MIFPRFAFLACACILLVASLIPEPAEAAPESLTIETFYESIREAHN